MQTKPKANSVITSRTEPGRIIFTVLGEGELTLNLNRIHPANLERAAIHGLIQRVSDRAAKGRDPETGKPASPAEKAEAMRGAIEHLESGSPDWGMRVATGETGGITLRALARVQGVEVAVMRERVERMAEKRGVTVRAYLAGVAGAEAVIRAIAAIRAEGGNAEVADAMLGELAEDSGE